MLDLEAIEDRLAWITLTHRVRRRGGRLLLLYPGMPIGSGALALLAYLAQQPTAAEAEAPADEPVAAAA